MSKRECPSCGKTVRVVKSITLAKTDVYVERFQILKCLHCSRRATLVTKEYIEWSRPK